MSALTTYEFEPDEAFAGMIADDGPLDIVTRRVSDAAGAPFGIGVAHVAATNKKDVTTVLTAITVAQFGGVLVHEHKQPDEDASVVGGVGTRYKEKDPAGMLKKGRVWVNTLGTVDLDGAVNLQTTAGADVGKFTSTSGSGIITIPNATWGTRKIDSKNIAVVAFNLP